MGVGEKRRISVMGVTERERDYVRVGENENVRERVRVCKRGRESESV